jgi:hypothetical protein
MSPELAQFFLEGLPKTILSVANVFAFKSDRLSRSRSIALLGWKGRSPFWNKSKSALAIMPIKSD